MKKESRSLIHLEIIRIIAIWFVVFNHTWMSGFMLYSAVGRSYRYYYPLLFLSILCKISVPLFFMISGALLIGKDENYQRVYGKRILRVVLVLFLFSALEYCYKLAGNGSLEERMRGVFSHFNIGDFCKSVYSEEQAAAYWYLYAYLAFLVMLPLLRRLAQAMKSVDFLYLILLQFVICSARPIMEYVLWRGECTIQQDFNIVLVASTTVFYPLVGYYLEAVLQKRQYTARNVLVLMMSGIIAIAVSALLTTHRMNLTGDKTAETFHSVLIIFPVAAVYFTIKYLCDKHELPNMFRNMVTAAGSTVFGIMLLEDILRKEEMGIFECLRPVVGIFAACVIWVTVVVVTGGVITWVLKHIPVLNRLL